MDVLQKDGSGVTLLSAADNADALVVATAGLRRTLAELMGYNGASWDRLVSGADNADAVAVGTLGRMLNSARANLFNGTTWDRQRGNVETGSLIAVTTASVNGADQTNFNARGIVVVADITAITGTNIVFNVQGKDPTSGKYYTILSSAALVATGTTVLTIYPGNTVTANVSASTVLPRTFRITTTATALTVMTATCAGILMV